MFLSRLQAYVRLVDALYALGKYGEAAEVVQDALDAHPGFAHIPEYKVNMGVQDTVEDVIEGMFGCLVGDHLIVQSVNKESRHFRGARCTRRHQTFSWYKLSTSTGSQVLSNLTTTTCLEDSFWGSARMFPCKESLALLGNEGCCCFCCACSVAC